MCDDPKGARFNRRFAPGCSPPFCFGSLRHTPYDFVAVELCNARRGAAQRSKVKSAAGPPSLFSTTCKPRDTYVFLYRDAVLFLRAPPSMLIDTKVLRDAALSPRTALISVLPPYLRPRGHCQRRVRLRGEGVVLVGHPLSAACSLTRPAVSESLAPPASL